MNMASQPQALSQPNRQLTDKGMTPECFSLLRHSKQAKNSGTPRNKSVTPDELVAGWSLLQMYGSQALEAGELNDAAPTKTLPERLAVMLVELSANEQRLMRGLSYQTLADTLGTQRETIAAILRAFRRQGFVELGYRHIRILEVEALADFGGMTEWL